LSYLIFLFKPIPIDSINKYWGVDAVFSKHDETLQKQSFDQSNKNFWSFVDYNAGDMSNSNMNDNVSGSSGFRNTSNNQTLNSNAFSGSGFSGSRSGGMGMQTNSNKISGLSYQDAKIKSTNN
jgi:hypothetical protein